MAPPGNETSFPRYPSRPGAGDCASSHNSGQDLPHRDRCIRGTVCTGHALAAIPRSRFAEKNLRHIQRTRHRQQKQEPQWAYFYGFLGGLSTVLAHAGGLVWSLYLLTAARDRRIFVGTTVILFFVTNIYKIVSYVWIDIISLSDLARVLPAIPMIFLGSYVGNIVNKRCNQGLFRKIVLCFIFFISITLCL